MELASESNKFYDKLRFSIKNIKCSNVIVWKFKKKVVLWWAYYQTNCKTEMI